jgi:hypothetical protein
MEAAAFPQHFDHAAQKFAMHQATSLLAKFEQ